MIKVVRYEDCLKSDWDSFLKRCKKKHFMFFRDYMDYHQERFHDHSLIFYNSKNNIIAILPANEKDNEIITHQGLSFGGFLVDNDLTCETMLCLFSCLKEYMKKVKFNKLTYKCIPRIYETSPSDEDLYALFINDAKLIRRDCSTAIDMENRIPFQKRRIRSIKKAIKNGVSVNEAMELADFWNVLSNVLLQRHDSCPVHSLEEIENLKRKFPSEIRCFTAEHEGDVVAGTLVYISNDVVHCQYLASNDIGKSLGALDFVLDTIIEKTFSDCRYIDFGISNEQQGRYLNKGLMSQKEGFGARTVVHDFYELVI